MKKFIFLFFSLLMGCYLYTAQGQDEVCSSISHPIVTVTLSNKQTFKIELYPEKAPNTVQNLMYLIQKGFYEDLKINEIKEDYLISFGDPIGDGTGFPGYYIRSECQANGYKNNLSCKKGVVCMARAEAFNTEGSQFFVLLEDAFYLNGQYTTFGKVIEGLDMLSEIKKEDDLKIQKMTVNTFGEFYDSPEMLNVFKA